MADAVERIRHEGLVAVVQAPHEDVLFEWAVAASKGGIQIVGIPVSAPYVTEVTADLTDHANLTVGVTGVVSEEQAMVAVAAGADFVHCPIADPTLIRSCQSRGIEIIGGAATPTEVVSCLAAGPDAVTIHPAGALGADYFTHVRSLAAAPLFVSGSVDIEGAPSLIEVGAVGAFVDRGLFPKEFDPASLDVITMRAAALVEILAELRGDAKDETRPDASPLRAERVESAS